MSMFVKFDGTVKGIEREARETVEKAQQAVSIATLSLFATAVEEAPVRTGFLRASHVPQIGRLKAKIIVLAKYGPYVHDGTRRQSPNPWLSRAREIEIDKWNALEKVNL